MAASQLRQLDDGTSTDRIIPTGQIIDLSEMGESTKRYGVQIVKKGSYSDPRYGDFEITDKTFSEIIQNFNAQTYGQKIFVNVAHKRDDGAAAEIENLYTSGDWLLGDIDFTEFGIESVRKKRYIYVSAEYQDDYRDKGALLSGAALTINPFIKGQDGIALAESSNNGNPTMSYRNQLVKYLSGNNAGNQLSESVLGYFDGELTKLGDKPSADAQEKLLSQAKAVADASIKQLAATGSGAQDQPINLSVNVGEGISLSDVETLLAANETKRLQDIAAGEVKLTENQAEFTRLLAECEDLDDDTRKELADWGDTIDHTSTPAQIKKVAESAIKFGKKSIKQIADLKLAEMGYEIAGSPRISVGEDNSIKKLQDEVDKKLGIDDRADSIRFQRTGGQLQPENKKLADAVMATYDNNHRQQLMHEAKMLDDTSGTISDTAIPGAFERTVLREALYTMIGLQFVNGGTAEFGESLYLPYSYRKQTAASLNDTRVYEGQGIQRAGVVQTGETAYPLPQKLAFEVSDELRYLTSGKRLNWEAVSENQTNATRIIGEDTDRLIFNEQVQASDEYQAVLVVNEDLAPQGKKVALIGNTTAGATITTVCRPRKIFNLEGEQIGNTVNEVIVKFDGAPIEQYNPLAVDETGASTLAVGNYYVLDYDIGECWIVDKDGAIVATAGKAWTISYSKATNVAHFDEDVPAGTKTKEHWDGFLSLYGRRKTLIEDTRFYAVSFGLMSGSMMDDIEQAEKFSANHRVPATELSANGNLGRIKDIPNFKTSASGLWIGDRRALIGERNVSRFRITKPWTMGQLENQKDENGRFTGKKEAYGDQFLILHTPKYLKAAMTSIVMYSKSARVARDNP